MSSTVRRSSEQCGEPKPPIASILKSISNPAASVTATVIGEMPILLKKVSIRSAGIVLPAVVAVIFAWSASSRHHEQQLAIDHFRSALRSGYDAAPNDLVAAYGIDSARDLMVRHSTASTDIAFDGTDRWAQILHVPYAYQHGEGDGYVLYAVGDTTRHIRNLPRGAILQSLKFDDDELVFCVYGNITQGSYTYSIPKDIPAAFRIEWMPGTSPSLTCVEDLMSRQYCVEGNRSN